MLRRVRSKHLHTWAGGYLRHLWRRARDPRPTGARHLLFALCDHFEPRWADASRAAGTDRVAAWQRDYPRLADRFRDAGGRTPRHTFFFPFEQYDPDHLDRLAHLVASGYGEVECHLHHDRDSSDGLRAALALGLRAYSAHGHLSTDSEGRTRFAFIHGNWCLANARADGRWCGVDDELALLFDAGCYADFTFPSAPDPSQPPIVNQIYWPAGDPSTARCYHRGERAGVGLLRCDRVLMIQGPLAPRRDPGRLLPRIETGAITAADPATPERVASWVRQSIHVAGRPEWVFVKVHTHGAGEAAARSLLGAGGRALHEALARFCAHPARWRLHYVTAREMYNIAVAAMAGMTGDPEDYRDYALPPPEAARTASRSTAASTPAMVSR